MAHFTAPALLLWTARVLCLFMTTVADSCTGPLPVIEPPHLVVKYGDPASATCTAPSEVGLMTWEATVGSKSDHNIKQLVWNITSVTDWSLSVGVMCSTNGKHGQCFRDLPITIYKNPDSVRLIPITGPLREGEQYNLSCEVQSVAPVDSLTVIWFRGDQEVGQSDSTRFHIEGDKSQAVMVMATLTITASREDHKASYSCAAHLDLNTTEPISDTKSNSTQVEVTYKPRITQKSSQNVSLGVGDLLELRCLADANPSPTYEWRHDNRTLRNETNPTLRIESASVEQTGGYECIASNPVGEESVTMRVDVYRNHTVLIAIVLAAFVLALIVGFCVAYRAHHMKNKTGEYRLTNVRVSSTPNGHVAQANGH